MEKNRKALALMQLAVWFEKQVNIKTKYSLVNTIRELCVWLWANKEIVTLPNAKILQDIKRQPASTGLT